MTIVATNHVFDPSTNDGTLAPWVAGLGSTVDTVVEDARRAFQITGAGFAATDGFTAQTVGTFLTFAAEVKAVPTGAGMSTSVTLRLQNDVGVGGVEVSEGAQVNAVAADSVWRRIYLTGTVVDGTVNQLNIINSAADVTLYVRDVQINDGHLIAFFDGDTPDSTTSGGSGTFDNTYSWTGTPYASPSIWDQVQIPDWQTAQPHRVKAPRDRTIIDGQDVTFWRLTRHGDQPLAHQGYTLHEPFAYGNAQLTIPRINPIVERWGQASNDTAWIRKGAIVKYQRVWYADDETTVTDTETDYLGVVVAIRLNGNSITLDIVGHLEGRLALMLRTPPVFRRTKDVGAWVHSVIVNQARQHMEPVLGPVTGIPMPDEGRMTELAFLEKVGAMSQDSTGAQRAVMPATWGKADWRFNLKDRTTVHYTLFADGARIKPNLVDDATEQPNRIYGNGQELNGMRWRNAKAPGITAGDPPAYPMAGGVSFGIGTVDADTINGDGISVMHARLIQQGYLDHIDSPDSTTYTAVVADAVEKFQADVHMSVTGTMTTTGWDRLFDLNVTGYSLAYAAQHPLVQDPRIPYWILSANGSIVALNDAHDRNLLRVDREYDHGLASKVQATRWTRGMYARLSAQNLVGTIELDHFGAFAGSWDGTVDPGDTNVIPGRSIRPGQNVRLPYLDGDTLFHISGVKVEADNKVALTVDTQARDLLELSQIIARNRESSRDIRREWYSINRRNAPSGSMVTWDEIGGILSYDKALRGDRWNVFPLPVGQQGQVSRTIMQLTNDEAAFAICFFSKHVRPSTLNARIGNPLAAEGDTPWYEDEGVLGDWFESRWMLYAAGTQKQPAGYHPRKHTNSNGITTSAPITGKHLDDAPWPYIMAPNDPAVLWAAVYPDRDCTIRHGRILYKLEDDAI